MVDTIESLVRTLKPEHRRSMVGISAVVGLQLSKKLMVSISVSSRLHITSFVNEFVATCPVC